MLLCLIYTIATSTHLEEFKEKKRLIKTSIFFKYYENTISKHKGACASIGSCLYSGQTKTDSLSSMDILLRTTYKMLTDDSLDPLLCVIVNSKKLMSDLSIVSPFGYILISHINRIYNYCIQEKTLRENIVNERVPVTYLVRFYYKVINPNFDKTEIYSSKSACKHAIDLIRETVMKKKPLEYFYRKIYKLEYLQLEFDFKHITKLRGRHYFEINHMLTYLSQNIIDHTNSIPSYILLDNGLIDLTVVSSQEMNFYLDLDISLPFEVFNYPLYYINDPNHFLSAEDLFEILKDPLILNIYELEVYISLLFYYTNVYKHRFIILIAPDGSDTYSVCLKSVGECTCGDDILDYYKSTANNTEAMRSEIEKRIKMGQNHEFITMINRQRYTFDKPATDSEPAGTRCLQLVCGHFLGHDLVQEYFQSFEMKCYICNKPSLVECYFEMPFYEIN